MAAGGSGVRRHRAGGSLPRDKDMEGTCTAGQFSNNSVIGHTVIIDNRN